LSSIQQGIIRILRSQSCFAIEFLFYDGCWDAVGSKSEPEPHRIFRVAPAYELPPEPKESTMTETSSSTVDSILQAYINDHGRDVIQTAMKRLQCGPDFASIAFEDRPVLHQQLITSIRSADGCEHLDECVKRWKESRCAGRPSRTDIYRIKSTIQLPPAVPEVFWGELADGFGKAAYICPPNRDGIAAAEWDCLDNIAGCMLIGFFESQDSEAKPIPFYINQFGMVSPCQYAKFQIISRPRKVNS
jgi:hypothetical protein